MNTATMTTTQQSPTWRLAPGQALRLPAVGRERWLRVLEGEVWLTLSSTPASGSDDTWLAPGGQSLLPAGREVVLEGHPRASFQLLEPARSINGASPSGIALSGWLKRLSLKPAPPCEAC